jgi:formamidopyrimidine-DNA glycosylase
VLHLMIAGRLHWQKRGAASTRKSAACAFDFPDGTLLLTESGSRKRSTLHLVRGESALRAHDPGGIEPLEADLAAFQRALTRESHTLKRALTDPRIFAGIGNAYSDEILHRARLSPTKRTRDLGPPEIDRLHRATQEVLREWIERLRGDAAGRFPEKVTAFRAEMAAHGRHREPCPDCGSPIQRIVHGEHETNYCARCQTGGRLLADRALSRLLREDWPRTLEELEQRLPAQRADKEGS